jgi:hypothetical protein
VCAAVARYWRERRCGGTRIRRIVSDASLDGYSHRTLTQSLGSGGGGRSRGQCQGVGAAGAIDGPVIEQIASAIVLAEPLARMRWRRSRCSPFERAMAISHLLRRLLMRLSGALALPSERSASASMLSLRRRRLMPHQCRAAWSVIIVEHRRFGQGTRGSIYKWLVNQECLVIFGEW